MLPTPWAPYRIMDWSNMIHIARSDTSDPQYTPPPQLSLSSYTGTGGCWELLPPLRGPYRITDQCDTVYMAQSDASDPQYNPPSPVLSPIGALGDAEAPSHPYRNPIGSQSGPLSAVWPGGGTDRGRGRAGAVGLGRGAGRWSRCRCPGGRRSGGPTAASPP